MKSYKIPLLLMFAFLQCNYGDTARAQKGSPSTAEAGTAGNGAQERGIHEYLSGSDARILQRGRDDQPPSGY